MQFFKLLAPAALVALANAQFYDDDSFDILAREEAPGYDDLGVFIRDVDDNDFFYDLKTREAEPELLFSDDTGLSLAAREADQYGEFDSLISLEGREADPEAEASPEAKKRKHKKKNRKHKKKSKKGKKKGKKSKKGRKGRKNKSKSKKKLTKAQRRKKAAQRKKQQKLDKEAEKFGAFF